MFLLVQSTKRQQITILTNGSLRHLRILVPLGLDELRVFAKPAIHMLAYTFSFGFPNGVFGQLLE